jgi:hypothetical protein
MWVTLSDSLEEGRIDKRGEPSELSLLWEVKLKSDFGIAKAAFEPKRTSAARRRINARGTAFDPDFAPLDHPPLAEQPPWCEISSPGD